MVAHCSGCVFTTVCVHLDGLNAERKFRVWVTILGHTSPHYPLRPIAQVWSQVEPPLKTRSLFAINTEWQTHESKIKLETLSPLAYLNHNHTVTWLHFHGFTVAKVHSCTFQVPIAQLVECFVSNSMQCNGHRFDPRKHMY